MTDFEDAAVECAGECGEMLDRRLGTSDEFVLVNHNVPGGKGEANHFCPGCAVDGLKRMLNGGSQ